MVKIISSELVVPSEETSKNPIWLSNLDLTARRGYTTTVYFYQLNKSTSHDFSVESLKLSLAKALVPFYLLAGRLGVDNNGRLQINCTGEGVLFVVAHSDATLDDFGSFAPTDEMRNLFVPLPPHPDQPSIPLMLQVTIFKCGGVALGTALHHTFVDGRGAFHFFETWANIARGEANCIEQPCLDRTPLRARLDRKVMFEPLEYISDPKSVIPSGISTSYASSIIKISKKNVNALKLHCRDTAGARVSAFRAITALIWRCICMARKLDTNSKSRLYTMIDMRNRMCPPLPPTFFGNAAIRTSVSAVVGDIISGPINDVAGRLYEATNQGDDYVRSLINSLETLDMGNLPRSGLPASDLRVISWLGMPMYKADFGMGEPILCSPALMNYSGYVYLMDSSGKDAGVSVVVALEPENMLGFKELLFEELATLHA